MEVTEGVAIHRQTYGNKLRDNLMKINTHKKRSSDYLNVQIHLCRYKEKHRDHQYLDNHMEIKRNAGRIAMHRYTYGEGKKRSRVRSLCIGKTMQTKRKAERMHR